MGDSTFDYKNLYTNIEPIMQLKERKIILN